MREFTVLWVDAFTRTPLEGNACAVVLDASGLDDATMQALARETNLSETAFVFPGDAEADRCVRYFTPTEEIPLAGHPTIATTHALVETGTVVPQRRPAAGEGSSGASAFAGVPEVRLRMRAGLIPVGVRHGTYAMSQPPPSFLATLPRAEAAAALRLAESDLLAGTTPQTVSTGTPQLMIPLASRDALDRCDPDRTALFRHPRRDWFSVHVFAPLDGDAALVSRHFADFGDVKEDPFTGSATGGMAGYCARYGIVRERAYDVVQGMHVRRPGRAHVEVAGNPPDAIGRITVAGPAVTVMHATLRLP